GSAARAASVASRHLSTCTSRALTEPRRPGRSHSAPTRSIHRRESWLTAVTLSTETPALDVGDVRHSPNSLPETMQAVVLTGPNRHEVRDDVPVPRPGAL